MQILIIRNLKGYISIRQEEFQDKEYNQRKRGTIPNDAKINSLRQHKELCIQLNVYSQNFKYTANTERTEKDFKVYSYV